jgi:putative oxygen-independent coproporphyrinogen III oxidase
VSTPAGSLAFYIHIPYCVKRCGYCDFNTYTPSELRQGGDIKSVSQGYIDLLIKESELAPESGPIPTIFFGGGTPTLLEPDDLGRILVQLQNRFGFTSDCEITIEANPDSVTKEKLSGLRELGINRISFGMQSANQNVLKVLDRTHNPENVAKSIQWAKSVGFDEISVDLIYGAPGESLKEWEETVDLALSLPVTHISAYALIVEAGTKLAAQVRRGDVVMPDEDGTADKYLIADKKFLAAELHWYELSNWAKSGSQCRHNIAYWNGSNWWGLGPGAHSHIDGRRWWNVKHPTAYKKRIDADQSPMQEAETLDAGEIESERVMLQIRMPGGISIDSLSVKQIDQIRPYLTSGHLSPTDWNTGILSLTPSGRLIADRIVREILL